MRNDFDNLVKTTFKDIMTRANKIDDMFIPYMWRDQLSTPSNDSIPVTVHDKDTERVIAIHAAGFGKTDISIEYDKNVLSVSGNVINKNASTHYKYMKETSFNKTFPLFEDTHDVNNILAEYNDGVLTITIPKLEIKKTSAKSIEIK